MSVLEDDVYGQIRKQ